MEWYIYDLETGVPLLASAKEAAEFRKTHHHAIKQTSLANCWISTVFLGLDHAHGGGPPVLFETMVFPSHGDWGEIDGDRYHSRAEALEGHERMVEKHLSPMEELAQVGEKNDE